MSKPQLSWFVAITLGFAAFTFVPARLLVRLTQPAKDPRCCQSKTALSSSYRESLLRLKGWKTPQAGSIHLLSKPLKTTLSRGNQDLDELTWVSANGSIAGRVYATAILDRLNKTPKGQLFDSLLKDEANSNVAYLSAGSTCHYSVSDIAIDQRSAHPILKLLP
jgi:hypothetical protein